MGLLQVCAKSYRHLAYKIQEYIIRKDTSLFEKIAILSQFKKNNYFSIGIKIVAFFCSNTGKNMADMFLNSEHNKSTFKHHFPLDDFKTCLTMFKQN